EFRQAPQRRQARRAILGFAPHARARHAHRAEAQPVNRNFTTEQKRAGAPGIGSGHHARLAEVESVPRYAHAGRFSCAGSDRRPRVPVTTGYAPGSTATVYAGRAAPPAAGTRDPAGAAGRTDTAAARARAARRAPPPAARCRPARASD